MGRIRNYSVLSWESLDVRVVQGHNMLKWYRVIILQPCTILYNQGGLSRIRFVLLLFSSPLTLLFVPLFFGGWRRYGSGNCSLRIYSCPYCPLVMKEILDRDCFLG